MKSDNQILLEQLWEDILSIYNHFNFNDKVLIDGLMISSEDNYFFLYQSQPRIDIRIDKNYSLAKAFVKKESYINYKIHAGNPYHDKTIYDEIQTIELAYKLITPFLREVKLNSVLE